MQTPRDIGFAPVPGVTRGQVNRAGSELRRLWETQELRDETLEAYMLMVSFRETFQSPLKKTVMGLRSMVCSECPELKRRDARIPVTQRLKRQEQIVKKLGRFPDMQLSNMADIGGCRAVLPDRETVDRVVRRIRKNWDLVGNIRDTRDDVAESGYRALHVIVRRDGRRIEIQLRDPREHEWAVAVERTGRRLGMGLKEGEGPADLREYFRLASLGMYLDSVGREHDPAFDQNFAVARENVRHYFRR